MLVISRKKGQTLLVGSAEVKVVQCGPGRVRLSINAPKSIKVVRGELVPNAVEPVGEDEAVEAVDPGPGYRLLKPGEIAEKGDEYFSPLYGRWFDLGRFRVISGTYRRKEGPRDE